MTYLRDRHRSRSRISSAMLVGSTIGRHAADADFSEQDDRGFASARLVVVAVLVATAASWIPQLHLAWWQGAALGFATCVAAQVGDLVESAFKRDAGVKDAGEHDRRPRRRARPLRFVSARRRGVLSRRCISSAFCRSSERAQAGSDFRIDRIDRHASARRDRAHPRCVSRWSGLAAGRNLDLLADQARGFGVTRYERRRRRSRWVASRRRRERRRTSSSPRRTARLRSRRSSRPSNAASTLRSPIRN